MADGMTAIFLRITYGVFHSLAIVAMEAIAFYHRSSQCLAPKNMLETVLDRRRTGAGRPGNGDDGVLL